MSYADAVDEYIPAVSYAHRRSQDTRDRCKTCKGHYAGCWCGSDKDNIKEPTCYDPYRCLFDKELADG